MLKTPEAEANADLSDLHILLVEDEVIIALDLKESLQEAGARVSHARSQSKGVELASKVDFDAAVLDVNLGGGATCEPIAVALKEKQIPFILHTGDLVNMGELVQRLSAPIAPKPMRSQGLIDMLINVRSKQSGSRES